jgi:hypothetical protein
MKVERKFSGLRVLEENLFKIGKVFEKLSNTQRIGEEDWKERIFQKNPWFTVKYINLALKGWSLSLTRDKIAQWIESYPELEIHLDELNNNPQKVKTIGLILAGNIPMVGFQDILCVLVSGHRAQIKLSSADDLLIPQLLNKIFEENSDWEHRIQIVDRLHGMDSVIATGSNNSARYFEYYFGKYPHIIRKNRNSVALLSGAETDKELRELGKDIFNYFGFGCRNVSKLYVPEGYDFTQFFDNMEPLREEVSLNKYLNNVEYQNAMLLLNQSPHLQNGFLFLVESSSLSSPISILHFEYFTAESLPQQIFNVEDQIQCIVGSERNLLALGIKLKQKSKKIIPFGQSQFPELWDYADGKDVLQFLMEELEYNFNGISPN